MGPKGERGPDVSIAYDKLPDFSLRKFIIPPGKQIALLIKRLQKVINLAQR